MLDAFETNQIGDAMAQAYLDALGTLATGRGIGADGSAYGVQDKIADVLAALLVSDDSATQADLTRGWLNAQADFTALKVVGERFRPVFGALSSHVKRRSAQASISGVSTWDTWLTYLNTGAGGTWTALQAPEWYDLFNAILQGTNRPSAKNLYFEVLQGSTYTNAVRKHVVGTGNTAGFDIDSTKYAGGVPVLNVSSFAGSSDTVTVTGQGFDPATGALTATGVTWTFTVSANGRFYRVGGDAPANSLIVNATLIAAGASITASTVIYVEAERPAVRTGTSQAGAATTITLDAGAVAVDDYYNGLTIAQAADLYDPRTITDYVGSTKVATVNSAWTSNPSTTAFRIFRTKPS